MTGSALRVALVTCGEIPTLIRGDKPIASALRAMGHEATPVIWDDPAVDWSRFDAIVVQSPWDYYIKHTPYFRWLDHLERIEAPVLNPTSILRWNAHKGYLLDLEKAGCAIVPTALYRQGAGVTLDSALADLRGQGGWESIVFKPAISGAGLNTVLLHGVPTAHHRAQFQALLANEDMLIQPFLPEIGTKGEVSLIFFGGSYSHGVLKTAKRGEFRIQSEHGGQTQPFPGTPELITLGKSIMSAATSIVGEPPFYGRVDLVESGGAYRLMELELIEPERFFDFHPGSAEAYARAILAHPILKVT